MLQQNLATHADQNNSACQLCFGFVLFSEDITDLDAEGGANEGDDADEGYSRYNAYFEEGESHAYGQSVDAGGYSQREHSLGGQGTVVVISAAALVAAFLFQGFLDHGAADQA